MDLTMGVYTHILHGDDSMAIEALPLPQRHEVIATGTDGSFASPKDGVRNHVQTAVFTRDRKYTSGNKGQERANSCDDCKSLNSGALGNKKAPLSSIVSEAKSMGGTPSISKHKLIKFSVHKQEVA